MMEAAFIGMRLVRISAQLLREVDALDFELKEQRQVHATAVAANKAIHEDNARLRRALRQLLETASEHEFVRSEVVRSVADEALSEDDDQ